jgi:hypothetical protein
VVIENARVRLGIIPALGGRVLEFVLKKDGRNRLYQNTIWRPTKWGVNGCRPDGGWKAIGGIEFSFPVCEHGCIHDRTFGCRVEERIDGTTVHLTYGPSADVLGLALSVDVTLEKDADVMRIDSRIENPAGNAPQLMQYWINAMLAPAGHDPREADVEFLFPPDVRQMRMHGWTGPAQWTANTAAGAIFPWPSPLARYDNFHAIGTAGFFTPAPVRFQAIFSHKSSEGMLRLFRAPQGAKVFALGIDELTSHSDCDRPYIELWSGVTPDFWTNRSIAPGERLSCSELWIPFWAAGRAGAVERIASLEREFAAAFDLAQ